MSEDSISTSILKLTRHSAIYGLGHILNRALGFLLLPIYTNYISPKEFGKAALLFLFIGLMTIVYQLGFSQAFLRYFSLTDDREERKAVFTNSFLSVFFLGLFFSSLVFFFSGEISDFIFHSVNYRNLILISVGILLGDVLGQIPLIILRVEERSVQYLFLTIVQIIINVIFNVFFIVHLKWGIKGIFAANLISSLSIVIVLIPTCAKYFSFKINFQLIYTLLIFGFPYMFSSLAKVLMDLADRFLLERLTTMETVGIYNAGYKLAGIMGLVVAGFRFAWMPYSLSIASHSDAKRIYSLITTYFILFSGWMFLVFAFFVEPLVKLKIGSITIFGEEYWQGINILPLIMGSYLLYGIYSILVVEIYIKKRSHVLLWITGIGALSNIALNLILIPHFGMNGAAWATILAYFVMVGLIYRDTMVHFPIPFEYMRILIIVIIMIIFYFSGGWILKNSLWVKFILIFSFPLVLFPLGFFHKEESTIIRNMLLSFKRKG